MALGELQRKLKCSFSNIIIGWEFDYKYLYQQTKETCEVFHIKIKFY